MVDEFEANRRAYLDGVLAECEADGLALVRIKYADRGYPGFALEVVRAWIAETEEAQEAARARVTWWALAVAIIAAIAAVIAAATGIIGLARGG